MVVLMSDILKNNEEENIVITKNKVAGSFVWKLLERVFSQGLSLVVQIILARILLPKDFGDVAIIVAFVNYAALFVQSGLGTAIVQKKNLDKLDIQTLMTASLSIVKATSRLLTRKVMSITCCPFWVKTALASEAS